jgi:SAM-dependent methyltransferase
MSTTTQAPTLKDRHRATWAAGDYGAVADRLVIEIGPRIVDRIGVRPESQVLDVATGTGNAAIPAAATGARVIGLDLVPDLLAVARRRAADAGVAVEWLEGDAEDLPFEDGRFDVVLSTLGVQFAPDHGQTARELARVCRPGGRIGLCNWTPEGYLGRFFAALSPYMPAPPAGASPPPLWGSEAHVHELFGERLEFRSLEREVLKITAFEHPHDYATHFKDRYGPTIAAQANARRTGREAEFEEALNRFCDEWNRGTPDRARFEQEYLVAVGSRA